MHKAIEHHFEVTVVDYPLTEMEEFWVQTVAELEDIEVTISKSKRIILFSNIGDIHILIRIVARMGLAEDVGMIKEITEYFPNWETIDVE